MQVTVEKTGPCEAKVSFTVPHDEFQSEYQKGLKQAGSTVKMKGFRPGKVPTKVLEKSFGADVRRQALEQFFKQAYEQAVTENELKPVGHQRVPIDELDLASGKDIQQSFEISLRPEFTLGNYKGLTVESELAPVMDQEIEAAIEDLRRQRATPEKAGDEGLPEDGVTVCKLEWKVDGETILEREGLRLSPLQPVPGNDPDAYTKALTSAKEGDVVEVPLTVPEDFDKEDLRGKTGTSYFTIVEAYRLVLPSDEEIFKLLQVDNAEELNKVAKDRLTQAKIAQENGRQETLLLEQLIEAHSAMDLPAAMLEAQAQGRTHALRQQLEQQGFTAEAIEAEVEKQADAIRKLVEKGLRAFFLVHAVADKEGIKLSQEDLNNELMNIANRNQASVEEVAKYYRENNLFEQMAIELTERKVRKYLREHAKVTEPS
ncbi:MAG: trigger factor [Planctomycetes bacterium]|nr:trigger factor [Planctomycetota bacterium]